MRNKVYIRAVVFQKEENEDTQTLIQQRAYRLNDTTDFLDLSDVYIQKKHHMLMQIYDRKYFWTYSRKEEEG